MDHLIPTREELVALYRENTLANKLGRRFGLANETAIRQTQLHLAALHNEDVIDLLLLIESMTVQDLQNGFWTALLSFCQILPELKATPVRMMACVDVLVTRGGKDLAAYNTYIAFRTWCATEPNRAHAVIEMAQSGDELAKRYLTFALEAINGIDEARKIALAPDDLCRLSAIMALSRIVDRDPTSCAETLEVFGTLLNAGADDRLQGSLLQATAAILNRGHSVSPEIVSLVKGLVRDAGEITVDQCAYVLNAYPQALDPDIVSILLEALTRLNPANKGTVDQLDFGLKTLMDHGYEKEAITYVTRLLSLEDGIIELKEFNSFTDALIEGPPERLSRVVVQWLLLGAPRLCKGLVNALRSNDLHGRPVELMAADLTISPMAQEFICRKAIGWFFYQPVTATSILVSVLRVCNDETAEVVRHLLVEHLLLNYHSAREYLETLPANDSAIVHADQFLAQIKDYHNALRTIPLLKELRPSVYQRSIEKLRMSVQMRDVHKQAMSESILFHLVKQSVMLYGNSAINFISAGYGTSVPMEMKLNSYEVSQEIPRMHIIDPVGLDYTLRVFRIEKMGS